MNVNTNATHTHAVYLDEHFIHQITCTNRECNDPYAITVPF